MRDTAARSSAMPTRPSVPSSNRRPIERRRRAARGAAARTSAAGAPDRAPSRCAPRVTSTKPARSVSDGWPVKFEIVSISSRSDGTSSTSTCRHDARHLDARPCGAAGPPARNPPPRGSAPARNRFGQRVGHLHLQLRRRRATASAPRTPPPPRRTGSASSEPYGQSGSVTSTGTMPELLRSAPARRGRRRSPGSRSSTPGSSRRAARFTGASASKSSRLGTLDDVARVGAGDRAQHEQRVLDAARHRPELVERPAQRHRAGARHAAEGRAAAR